MNTPDPDTNSKAHRVFAKAGPLECGADLGDGWEIESIAGTTERLEITVRGGPGKTRFFVVPQKDKAEKRSPFEAGQFELSYAKTDLVFEEIVAPGKALALLLSQSDIATVMQAEAGVSQSPEGEGNWRDLIRRRLLDKPNDGLALGDVLAASELPTTLCTLPWTRLEMSTQRTFGPCCSDFQSAPAPFTDPSDIAGMWNSNAMRAFRRALASSNEPKTCRSTCPHLQGAMQRAERLMLRGGPHAFVENQILLVEELLDGGDLLKARPMELCLTPTTYCNYDCLMCEWGEIGTLDDQYGVQFYEQLEDYLGTLHLIEAAGGEPLASMPFRDFLATVDFNRYPQLRVSLTTNGSYLTPGEQERLGHVPFSNLTISLNAATDETYATVNRGLAYERVRTNLDSLLARRAEGLFRGSLVYSMVILKSNVSEIEQLAELAWRDGALVRYMLPMYNRNNESILTEPDAMRLALASLERVAAQEESRGFPERARWVRGESEVLDARLTAGVFRPLPDP